MVTIFIIDNVVTIADIILQVKYQWNYIENIQLKPIKSQIDKSI